MFFVVPGNQGNSTKPFVTPSYQWGTLDSILPTVENEQQVGSGRPTKNLPRIFEEAFFVARYIEIRFVDRLSLHHSTGGQWEGLSIRM
ncbi:hypothetical protein F5Y09DRAFT_89220 [Xylaria sp. FL1042]|nr:hypothetical protein F5Y09DRAFT_89220 [Xylaria sp. FL1042]